MRIQPFFYGLLTALVLPGATAHAGELVVDLLSNGSYQTYRLPDGIQQVTLDEPLAGGCSFNRTWGYDLNRKELWVRDGCGARFRMRTLDDPRNPRDYGNSNWYDRDHRDNDRNPGYYPPPAYPSRGGQPIRGQNGLCLDVSGGLKAGNELIVFRCAGTDNQQFNSGRNGEMRVGNLCLDVANGNRSDGARVIAWECRGQPNQSWSWSRGEIRSNLTGKCLDIEGGRARSGQAVVMWPCSGAPNQRWN